MLTRIIKDTVKMPEYPITHWMLGCSLKLENV